MGRPRKGDSRYRLGVNVLGKPAWLLRDGVEAASSGGAGSVSNLLGVSGEGVGVSPADVVLPPLPYPSRELERRLLSSGDWSGLDLRGVLSRAEPNRISGVSFAGSDLRGGWLGGAVGDGVDFSGARTAGLTLDRGVSLRGVKTDGVFDLSDVVLGNASIEFANRTRLVGFRDVRPSQHGGFGTAVRFGNVDFTGERFGAGDFDAFAEFRDGDFSGAVFDGGEGGGFVFRGTRFAGCGFVGARLRDAEMSSVYFEVCDLSDADMSGWSFDGVGMFRSCRFAGADMSGWSVDRHAGLCDIEFEDLGDLGGADLSGMDGRLLAGMVRSGLEFERFTVAEVAERTGRGMDEFVVLAWAGELEVRDRDTHEVVSDSVGGNVYVPEWTVGKLL